MGPLFRFHGNPQVTSPPYGSTPSDIAALSRWRRACVPMLLAVMLSTIACTRSPQESTSIVPSADSAQAKHAGEGAANAKSDKPTPAAIPFTLPATAVATPPAQIQAETEAAAAALCKRFPKSPAALHAAAMLHADLHQTAKAEDLWRKCRALDPDHAGAAIGLATIASGRGDDEAAVQILREALAKNRRSAEMYYYLAMSLAKQGENEEAVRIAQQGLGLFPQSSSLWLLLGENQLRLGRLPDAEESLRKAIDLGARTAGAYHALSNACARQGKTKEAETFRQRFTELQAKQATPAGQWSETVYPGLIRHVAVAALANFGEVYAQQQAPEEAHAILRQAVALDPANPRALSLLATIFYSQKRLADAQTVLRRLIDLEPTNPFHQFNLGNVSSELDDLPAAEAAYLRFIQMNPHSAIGYEALAKFYWKAGAPEQGRLVAEEAIRREATPEGLRLLASICRDLGDDAAAQQAEATAEQLTNASRPASEAP